MTKQRLSNIFKLRMYSVEDVVVYCFENDIDIVVNDFEEIPTEYEVSDISLIWKVLLNYKPYDKYSK